jgi:hypothetical protein
MRLQHWANNAWLCPHRTNPHESWIRKDILEVKRAEYGERIVSALGRQLEAEFGRGFTEKSLRHMLRFTKAFPDDKIVSALTDEQPESKANDPLA